MATTMNFITFNQDQSCLAVGELSAVDKRTHSRGQD